MNSVPARAAIYALFSRLFGSPQAQPQERAWIEEAVQLMGQAGEDLPYAWSNKKLLASLGQRAEERAREYTSLFEVGDQGERLALCAEQALAQQNQVKEEVCRFYDHFHFALQADAQWRPDHLAVMLEFLYFLALGEAACAQNSEQALSYQLAQRDFSQRLLLTWLPALCDELQQRHSRKLMAELALALLGFLKTDMAWQQTRLAQYEG